MCRNVKPVLTLLNVVNQMDLFESLDVEVYIHFILFYFCFLSIFEVPNKMMKTALKTP